MPALSGSSVVLGDTLLENLSPAESTAIFAHEVAHLEHYDRERLRRARLAMWVMVALLGDEWRPAGDEAAARARWTVR